jgi:hypothetical protein
MAYNVTAWRCGGILCSFCRQLKPIKDIMFNGFYCSLIYNIKLELPMNSELQLIAPTSSRHNAKPIVASRPFNLSVNVFPFYKEQHR